MDPVVRDEAVVLRHAPWSNTSRYALWMTRAHGRVLTLVKGSQRPKSPFLGQYDVFQTCELLFYARERNGLHMIRECAPRRTRPGLRARWRACAAASYAADLVARALPADAPAPAVFDALEAALDALADGRSPAAVLAWFELRILEHLGFTPRFDACAACGAEVPAAAARQPFAVAAGGVLCGPCAATPRRDLAHVGRTALGRLRAWQAAATPADGPDAAGAGAGSAALLGDFLRHHLDLPLASREVALAVLAEPDAAGLETGAAAR
jgi:DNA repair protein RecO (recombination protein O)